MTGRTAAIRVPFLAASLVSAAWLGLAVWVFRDSGGALASPQFFPVLAAVFAPVAACYALAAALVARPAEAEALPAAASGEEELQEAGSRIAALRSALAAEADGLRAINETLSLQAASVAELVQELGRAGTAAMEAGQTLDMLLPKAAQESAGLRAAMEAAAAGADTVAGKALAATREMADGLAALQQQGESTATAIAGARSASEAGTRAIRGEADSLFETLENTHVARREALAREGEAMAQQLQAAYARLESLAARAGDDLATRLGAVDNRAAGIEGRLRSNAALVDTLLASGERAFQLLDARLAHSNETTERSLDRLAARLQEAGAGLAQFAQPIRDTGAATAELEQKVASLREEALKVVDLLGKAIPEQAHEAGRATADLAGEVESLGAGIATARDAAVALHEPLLQQQRLLEEAGATAASERQASETAAAALVVELQQGRQIFAEVETAIRTTSLAAASDLVDTMSRLRDVVSQTGGSFREVVDGVVAEAREKLTAAAGDAMRQSFAEPVARQAQQAEETAALAAERTAQSMAALADVLKMLETQVAERTARLESARQADLLAVAGLLTGQLAEASVSIASALGRPMDDGDWEKWRKGERALFHRRALSLLDRREAKELRQLLGDDAAFAESARSYSAAFEALVQRVGLVAPGLSALLQDSEQGRLAAALAEGLGG